MNSDVSKYRRDMGTLGVLFIVVNGLIGAGIFGLPEALHAAVGTFAPWLLLIGGVLVMAIVICFAELTRLTDRSGGPQRFVGDAFGAYPGFVVGWTFYAARLISQGANVLVLVAYAAALWPVVAAGAAKVALIMIVLGGITIINVGLGVFVAAAMALWGMPSPLVIGLMAFGLNFVPFLGGLVGATIAAAVAFVGLDGAWPAAGVFATYIALTAIEGQLVAPVLISRRMRLNTTVVLLSVAYFAWIWSVMGMVVALPILIVIEIACEETGRFPTLVRFLGDTDDDARGSQPADRNGTNASASRCIG